MIPTAEYGKTCRAIMTAGIKWNMEGLKKVSKQENYQNQTPQNREKDKIRYFVLTYVKFTFFYPWVYHKWLMTEVQ